FPAKSGTDSIRVGREHGRVTRSTRSPAGNEVEIVASGRRRNRDNGRIGVRAAVVVRYRIGKRVCAVRRRNERDILRRGVWHHLTVAAGDKGPSEGKRIESSRIAEARRYSD